MTARSHGTLAGYADEAAFTAALAALKGAGVRRVEAYAPYPIDGADRLLASVGTPVGWIMLAAAAVGGAGAFYLQWYAARAYPVDVGGRPINSWPAFIPITFELTVLTSALVGVAALLLLCGLPRLDHPLFSSPRFDRASRDRYFICIRRDEPRRGEALRILGDSRPETLEEVAP